MALVPKVFYDAGGHGPLDVAQGLRVLAHKCDTLLQLPLDNLPVGHLVAEGVGSSRHGGVKCAASGKPLHRSALCADIGCCGDLWWPLCENVKKTA